MQAAPLAIDVVGIANAAAAIGGFIAIIVLIVIAARPDRDREEEEEAREHFDRTGTWPEDL